MVSVSFLRVVSLVFFFFLQRQWMTLLHFLLLPREV